MARSETEMKLCLDTARCQARGACRAQMSARFRSGEGGRCELVDASVAGPDIAAVRAVVFACPSGALALEDDAFYDFANVGP